MRLYALLGALGLLMVASVSHGQILYEQDFSTNFPPPVDNPGRVTVILTNEGGETITPYVDFEVPGLSDYVGRPQFAARTGGANANQEVGLIETTYTLGGADTVEQYAIDPLPATGGNGAYEPEANLLTDQFITLSEDGIGGIQSAVAWDTQYSDGYNMADHTFSFRISGFADPANDQADGIGWAYLNVADHGDSGVVGPGTSEEPNFTGSLGLGIDIWDNGGTEGGNSVSLHFNGDTLDSRTIDPGTTHPDTGEEWAFNSFETDEIITATVLVTPGEVADTEPELIGGSQFTAWNRSGRPPELVQVGGEGSTEGYYRVAEESGGIANLIAFDHDGSDASDEYNIRFNFRGLDQGALGRADGMSFLLVPTETYGETGAEDTGADPIDFGPHEDPNLVGAFGVGFDTFQNEADSLQCEDCLAEGDAVANEFSVHFDGIQEDAIQLPLSEIDLVTSDPEVWHTADIVISGDDVAVVVTDGSDESVHEVFSGSLPGLSDIGPVRPVFAARTGGAADNYEIDNFVMAIGPITDGPRGDFNGDGVLDLSDINQLTVESASGDNDAEFDLTGDGLVDSADVTEWAKAEDIGFTFLGDSNLDGEFNSSDLVTVFSAGQYETGNPADWSQGDWNGDGIFSSSDLVTAFSDGGYENGPRAAVAAVPEPSSLALLLIGGLLVIRRRK